MRVVLVHDNGGSLVSHGEDGSVEHAHDSLKWDVLRVERLNRTREDAMGDFGGLSLGWVELRCVP